MTTAALRLLIGNDAWLASRLDDLRAAAAEWIHLRDGERAPGRMYQELRSYSFFGMHRWVCIDRADKLNAEEQQELTAALAGMAPNVTALLTGGATQGSEKLAATVTKLGATIEREPRGTAAMTAMLQGAPADAELRSLLGELYGDDPLRLKREIEKLKLYGGGEPLGVAVWSGMSEAAADVDGFRFARAVLHRDLDAADRILRDWEKSGGGDQSAGRDLLGAVGYVLRQYLTYRMAVGRGDAPAQAARQVPGRFTPDDQRAAAAWSPTALAGALDGLLALDRKLKTTSAPAGTALFQWCAALALGGGAGRR